MPAVVSLGVVLLALGVIGCATGGSSVHDAVEDCDPARVRKLSERGANLDSPDYTGVAPIHIAASQEDSACLRALLELGAWADTPVVEDMVIGGREDLVGATPLFYGARYPENVALLLGYQANPNVRLEDGVTPLFLAAPEPESTRRLLSSGADPNVASANGTTPLMLAISVGSEASTRLLLESGADPSAVGYGGQTPLLTAMLRDDVEIARILLAGGAVPVGATASGAWAFASGRLVDLTVTDDGGRLDGDPIDACGYYKVATDKLPAEIARVKRGKAGDVAAAVVLPVFFGALGAYALIVGGEGESRPAGVDTIEQHEQPYIAAERVLTSALKASEERLAECQ